MRDQREKGKQSQAKSFLVMEQRFKHAEETIWSLIIYQNELSIKFDKLFDTLKTKLSQNYN